MRQKMIGRSGMPSAEANNPTSQRDSGVANYLLLPLCFMLATAYVGFFRGAFGVENFPDLQNYRNFFEGGYYVFILQRMSGFEYISSEAAWAFFVDFLIQRNLDIYQVLFITSVIALGSAMYYVYCSTQSLFSFLYFLNPLSMDLYIGQNRSALASGIFALALTIKNPMVRVAVMLFAGTFHISIFILTSIFILHQVYIRINQSFPNNGRRMLLFVFLVIFVALFAAFGRDATLYQLNDSRAEVFDAETSSWTYVTFWSSCAASYFFLRKEDFSTFPPVMILFCFASFILFTYTGNFSSRWAAYAIPFIAVASRNIKGIGREFFHIQFLLITIVTYIYWIKQAQIL